MNKNHCGFAICVVEYPQACKDSPPQVRKYVSGISVEVVISTSTFATDTLHIKNGISLQVFKHTMHF